MRNVLIAVANSKQSDLEKGVIKNLDSHSDLVRAMAVWAIYCLNKEKFYFEKNKRYSEEKSFSVRQEWINGEINSL